MGFGKGKGKNSKGKGKSMSAGKATSQWQQLGSIGKGRGGDNRISTSTIPPWRSPCYDQFAQSPWRNQQHQQHPHQPQQHYQTQQRWVCDTCGTNHPAFHVFCGTCHFAPTDRPPKAPKRRWSSRLRPKDIPEDWLHIDGEDDVDTDDNMYDIQTPKAPPSRQINSVLTWLQEDGCSQEVIDVIKRHQALNEPQPQQQSKDLWAELRSAKDKAKHIEQQLSAATVRVEKAQVELDAACALRDDLATKQQAILASIDETVAKLPHVDSLQSQLTHYESLLKKIQESMTEGIPEVKTPQRDKLYTLVFFGNESRPNDSCQEAPRQDSDDTSHLVDRSGFGFGPTLRSQKAATPYSAERPPATVHGTPDGADPQSVKA